MVKVTKDQQTIINSIKEEGAVLEAVINTAAKYKYAGHLKKLNGMSAEQVVLAWHGLAEVEKEYVSFEEAMKADEEGKTIWFHPFKGSTISCFTDCKIKGQWLEGYTLKQIYNGNFTIEGE